MRNFRTSALFVAMVLLSLAAGAAAHASGTIPSIAAGTSSPEHALAAQPEDKLSERLALLARSAALRSASVASQARTLGVAESGPGSLVRDPAGRLLVDIRSGDLSPASLQALRDAGALIQHVAERYAVATAYVAADNLDAVAALAPVQNIQEEFAPEVDDGGPAPARAAAHAPAACPQGAAVSEGDAQLNAATLRSTDNISGTGITIGAISDSYNRTSAVKTAAQDVASGDLPGAANPCGNTTPVNVLAEGNVADADEGRAMLQILHDLAPGAALDFATGDGTIFTFADNIRALHAAGASIIVDDLTYFADPIYQDGPISVAISDVVRTGALYFTSAGNANRIVGGHNITSYETPAYRPMARPAVIPASEESCHNFNPAGSDVDYEMTVAVGTSSQLIKLVLQWAQPWYGVTTNLDLYVTNGTSVIAHSANVNPGSVGTQEPFEFVQWFNNTGSTQTYHVYVCRNTATPSDAGTPRFKFIEFRSPNLTGVEYPVSSGGDIVGPSLLGHHAAPDAFSVAAAPYNDSNNPETFSSFGPATHYFGPVAGVVPAAAIPPTILAQPDFTATDGGCETFFSTFSSGCYRFFGTSAAAPHAAAVAALLKQQAASLSIPFYHAQASVVLRATARHMTGGVGAQVGAGLIDALAAAAKLTGLKSLFLPSILR